MILYGHGLLDKGNRDEHNYVNRKLKLGEINFMQQTPMAQQYMEH